MNFKALSKDDTQAGFSILELIVSLSIIALLSSFALPVFSNMISSTRIETTAHLLLSHLQLARHHALLNSTRVMICPREGDQCGENWNNGWLVFEDLDHDKKIGNQEVILQENRLYPKDSDTMTIQYRKRPVHAWYNPDGSAWPNGTFRICSDVESVTDMAVVLTMSGRPRIAGKHEAQERCE